MTMTDNTEWLIAEIKKGNRLAMQQLYCLSIGRLTAVCQRYVANDDDVKDILQDSYIKIFKALDTFVPHNDNSLNSWMAKIVANESLNFLRKRRRDGWLEVDTDKMPDMPEEDEDPNMHGVTAEELHDMLRNLPDGYRTVINLYVMEEYSHKEIAQMLGISEYTSASQLFHAKRALAKMINKRRTGK